MAEPGKVFLVGAGPGDPGMLTLRGKECLEQADVVLYDYLAGPGLLKWTRQDAELYCLGRHGQGKLWKQPEINARMVQEAQSGRTVVRLKGGDPAVFGRLAEEIDALTDAGLPFEIVPGVSAAMAAGAFAGITVTDRDRASCVTLLTGHEQPDKEGEGLDFAALAKLPGTLVVYMGVTTAEDWSGKLLEHGKPADTPVMLVRKCSLPEQQTFECTLDEVASVLAPGKVRPPIIAIIGPVAHRTTASDWFTQRPLFGQTILVTRPGHQAEGMVKRLTELGAEALVQPAIEIQPLSDFSLLDQAIERVHEFDWLVFSSRNGVEAFLTRLYALRRDSRSLAGVRLAAIGSATVEALAEHRLVADLCPDEYRAEALAESLAGDARGNRFLLLRASRGREVLAERLRDAGGAVEQVVVYNSTDIACPDPELVAAMERGSIQWTTVTSSAIARSLVKMFGEALRNTRLAAISPLTAGVLEELGYPADLIAQEYTTDGLIDALVSGRE